MNHKGYAEDYYDFQTQARGLVTAEDLERAFRKSSRWYDCRLGCFLPADRDARILDLPCGYGNFLYFLRQRGYRNVVGYDLDPKQIALAQLLDLPAQHGDAFEVLTRDEEPLDCIASIDFLEHVSKDAALEFLRLCQTRLRPGGVLLVRTPCADGPFGAHDAVNDLTHQWSLTSNVLLAILEMTHFDDVQILDERPQPYNIRNRVRLAGFHGARLMAAAFVTTLGLGVPRVWSKAMWGVARKPHSRVTRSSDRPGEHQLACSNATS